MHLINFVVVWKNILKKKNSGSEIVMQHLKFSVKNNMTTILKSFIILYLKYTIPGLFSS